MLKQAIICILGCFLSLEGTQYYDEPLSGSSWSHFGPLCKHYVLGRKQKPDAVYDILKAHVKLNATILDLGSGTGISTRQLYKHGFKNVIGLDRDPLMIKEAQAANTHECNIKYIRADIANGLPFPDGEFDVVTATSAFHWFSNPSSIRETARILKRRGYYFVIGGRSSNGLKGVDPIREKIHQIFNEAGVPPKPIKYPMSTARALEAQGFKIIVENQVPFEEEYTKQEFLERVQSHTSWNFVPESQREPILKKIALYLDSILNENGKIRQKGELTVILAQK